MSITTKISWTESTWNPWMGCTKVSEGCLNCYMFRMQKRFGRNPAIVTRCGEATFNNPLKWKESRLIFVCSWSDFFHSEADAWREDAWSIIRETPYHEFQILTKRPERIASCLPYDWPFENVWLGVTVENKAHGLPRMEILRNISAKIRFVSFEPLIEDLGEINLSSFDWAIVGGESGPKCRPICEDWIENIYQQCQSNGVLFFFKQWSCSRGASKAEKTYHGEVIHQMPIYKLL